MKTATKIVLGAAMLGAVIGVASVPSGNGSPTAKRASDAAPAAPVDPQTPEPAVSSNRDPAKDYVAQLERETASLSKGLDLAQFGNGPDAVFLAVGALKLEARLYYDGDQYGLTPKQERVRRRFEQTLIAAQRRAFPKLRKAWVEQAANKLWEYDVEVRALGARSDIIEFTGGMFAANANCKRMNDQFRQTFEDLRFRQSRFAWAHSVGYTYWNLNTSKDDALLQPVETDLAQAAN
ncbi:MAG TPA: hypothetical protein VHD95_07140 [Rhizomicrobium sp.]|nr:hypothetical protein [Rhizomicrobium sp.]